jgi:beta-glucanase (GH16 family)
MIRQDGKERFGVGFLPVLGSFLIIFLASTHSTYSAPPGYTLKWSDEFTNSTLNPDYWNYADNGWRNSAYNIPSAISITNGCLAITTYTEGGTNFTGFIDTADKVMNSYGYYEAKIKFSNAPGNWSAFWLQSTNNHRPIAKTDPANGVEIDIFEHRSVDSKGKPWTDGGDSALHWNGYGADAQSSSWASRRVGVQDGFHIYGLLWTADRYTFYVDGHAQWTTNYPVSSVPEFIRLTSEVKTGSWAGNVPDGGYPAQANSPLKMLVQYVRYYVPPPEAAKNTNNDDLKVSYNKP